MKTKNRKTKIYKLWINVLTGRLPMYEEHVLLYAHGAIVIVGYRDSTNIDGEKWLSIEDDPLYGITHWMPLPNPPQLKSEVKKLEYSNPMPDTINIKWK